MKETEICNLADTQALCSIGQVRQKLGDTGRERILFLQIVFVITLVEKVDKKTATTQ